MFPTVFYGYGKRQRYAAGGKVVACATISRGFCAALETGFFIAGVRSYKGRGNFYGAVDNLAVPGWDSGKDILGNAKNAIAALYQAGFRFWYVDMGLALRALPGAAMVQIQGYFLMGHDYENSFFI